MTNAINTTTARKKKKQPGIESTMQPKPKIDDINYLGSQKLKNKVAIITGGDSGIGHSIALFYAKEGADIVIAYLNEHTDAKRTKKQIESIGKKCILISGDLSKENFCKKVAHITIKSFGKINILVNNVGQQFPQQNINDITEKQLVKTFRTNIFSYFFMVKAVLPFLKKGSTIINTTSVTCYKGNEHLIDYSATKGAIVAFTRSLSLSIIKKFGFLVV